MKYLKEFNQFHTEDEMINEEFIKPIIQAIRKWLLKYGIKSIDDIIDLLKSKPKQIGTVSKVVNDTDLAKIVQTNKAGYIKTYGQEAYDKLFKDYLSGKISRDNFTGSLKVGGRGLNLNKSELAQKVGLVFKEKELRDIDKLTDFIFSNKSKISKSPDQNLGIEITKKLSDGRVVKSQPKIEFVSYKKEGWSPSEASANGNIVYFNLDMIGGMSKERIKSVFIHEIGHIKDPSLFGKGGGTPSPKLAKSYGPSDPEFNRKMKSGEIVAWESDEWFRRYLHHDWELNAQQSQLFNHMANEVREFKQNKLSKDKVLHILDSALNFIKSRDGETRLKIWNECDELADFFGYTEKGGNNFSALLTSLNERKPSKYATWVNKKVKHILQLKEEVKKTF